MSKKLLIQISIIIFIILIILLSYFMFFYEKNDIKISNEKSGKQIENKIVDLKYIAVDDKNNNYTITSDFGKVSDENENILNLINVKAIISLSDSSSINIYSDFAQYNKVTLDTYFYDNVRMLHEEHLITSDKIFLNYISKNIKVENNVIYQGNNNQLNADIIDIDLVTKISKIYMIEDQNNVKVKILSNGNN